MKKTRVILALLAALLVLWAAVPALADEGQGSMDVSPGEPDPPADTDPEPPPASDPEPSGNEDPEPPPADDDPTPVPGDEDPTPPPDDEPTPPPGDEDPTPPPDDEPTAEPTEEPTAEPPAETGGGSDIGGDNQGPATRPSVNMGGSIRQPTINSSRPSSGTAPSSSQSSTEVSQTPVDNGPQYVTFARVTQKSNAMSRTLFYSGAACVGTGVLGLIVLVVFMVRGRQADSREGKILAEIEQAAVRQSPRPVQSRQAQARMQEAYEDDPYAQYDRSGQEHGDGGYQQQYDPRYAQGYDSAPASLHRPEPEELAVPVNGSLYTEEFELPPEQVYGQGYQQGGYQPVEPIVPAGAQMYTEEFEPPREAVRPAQASVYTEEFSLPEDMVQPPVQQRPVQAAPAPARRQVRAQPRPSSQVPPDQMDTTELLREILHSDE